MIKQEGKKWILYAKDGSKVLGTFDTEEEAIEREKQIQYFKHKKEAEADALISQAIGASLLAEFEKPGNVDTLIATFDDWAGGSVTGCIKALEGKEGIDDAPALCAWIKDQAKGTGWRSEKDATAKEEDGGGESEPEPTEDASEPVEKMCSCPECGYEVAAGEGESCDIACAKCGAQMADKGSEPEPEAEAPMEEAFAESAGGIIQLIEAKEASDPRGPLEMEVAIIQPGFGNAKDGHYYPKDMLARHSHMFRGVKMFETDHRDEEKSTRTWVSTIVDVPGVMEDGTLRGRVVVHDPNFAERARNLKKAGLLNLLPNSIYASGTAREGEVEGRKAKIVEAINKVHSVDWVTAAGAGGHALDLFESAAGNENASAGAIEIEETTPQRIDRERVEVLLSEAGVTDPYLAVLAKRTYATEEEVREAALDMKDALREAGAGAVFGLGDKRSVSRREGNDRVSVESGILKRYGIGG